MNCNRIFACIYLFFISTAAFSQITGKISDENGDPLPYATVYLKNTTIGTTSNANGEFKLPAKSGNYDVVIQYIGYKQHIEKVTVGDKPARVTITMEPNILEISEVVITDEDPAYGIMRQAIAKRKYYRDRIPDYSCDVYVKGFHKVLDAPKKLMGIEIGEATDGMLDSTGKGVLYLSESVSRLYYSDNPRQTKEVMISSKTSGSENGFSMNRATLAEFSLYDERTEIDREILSPLADNAFAYYRFKLIGKYVDNNNFGVYKIQIIPKRSTDPVFGGHIYIVDDWYNLAGADIFLTGKTIKQPILDTLRFVQEFVPVADPDKWCLLSQFTNFNFKVLGFNINGSFNTVFSNYDIEPGFTEKTFDKEVFKVEKDATERDTTYWTNIRPVPLTMEERLDYVKKDSLMLVRTSKAYLDSIDAKSNRFKPGNLLSGYSWENSYKRISFEYPGAMHWVQFNTVQGWLIDIKPEFSWYENKSRSKFWQAEGSLNYGFSEKKLRGSLLLRRRFESIKYNTLEVSGGTSAQQFNSNQPITTTLNTAYSLMVRENHMKLYDQTFFRASWSQTATPTLHFTATMEYSDRRPLVNNSDFSWSKSEDRAYWSNNPLDLDGPNTAFFQRHQALIFKADLRFRFGQKYSTYPEYRYYEGSKWPDFYLRYRKAVPGVGGSDVDYDLLMVQVVKKDMSLGLAGHTDWTVKAGAFLRKKNLPFIDFHHLNGNQTLFSKPGDYANSFYLLPYYTFSTDRTFVEAHLQHHFQGWLFDKLPLLRKLNLKEVLSANFFWAEQANAGALPDGQRLPYWELAFGLENIGYKLIRPLRIDVANSFFGNHYHSTGVVIGISLNNAE